MALIFFKEELGMDYVALKNKYGTPLYVYDVNKIKNVIDAYQKEFKSKLFETEILYASKAFCIKEMLRLIQSKGLSLDVVSLGEFSTACAIDFDMNKVYYHGNNKTEEELAYAIEHNVGQIVVDNLYELKTLEKLACIYRQEINIYIRLNVGIEAHTHRYVITAHIDSKFGVLPSSKDFQEMLDIINQSQYLRLVGLHSHIGSQIFDLTAFQASIERLIQICKRFSYPLAINLGGGFGVKYTEADQPVPYDLVAKFLIASVEKELVQQNVHITKLLIEPGRSIVAEAGTTLYTIGSLKQTPNKLYYFIDGGMTDNIRPALYQATYAADIVGKEVALKNKLVTIAGKCCESGDLIIENTLLPEAEPNDLLVTYSTGAYGYSMSSNYNKALTPAVVFVEDGLDRLVVKRQTIEQLLEREI